MKSLVFVHGYLGGGMQWMGQVKAFSEHFRVITPDLPGFGENHAMTTPETIRELAQYVLNELDALEIIAFNAARFLAKRFTVFARLRSRSIIDVLAIGSFVPYFLKGKLNASSNACPSSLLRAVVVIVISMPRIVSIWS